MGLLGVLNGAERTLEKNIRERHELIECIRKPISALGEVYLVSKLGVFGPFARGEANESRDIEY